MNAYGRRGFVPQRATRLATPRLSLQRKCACGTHTAGSECAACAEQKLRIQRKGYGPSDEAPEIVQETLSQPGTGIDIETRGFMESRFGRDFSGVRIHTDAQAARSAQAVQAHAYTVGRDIVFADRRYAPASQEGRHLLAHELAHVVQQDGAEAASGAPVAIAEHDASEDQADRAADRAMGGGIAGAAADAAHGNTSGSGSGSGSAGLAANVSASASATAFGSIPAGLQRQSTGELPPIDDESLTRPGPAATCIQDVVGEDIPSLLQADAVTIVEFGAPWCGPCKQNLAGLRQVCTRLGEQPPSIPVRIYSINIDEEGNQGLYEAYTPGGIPHLYFYVGSTLKDHYTHGIDPDAMPVIVQEHIDYASTSGAASGARKGALWGMIPGAVVGIGGAIALGAAAGSLGLGGNALMGAVLGSLAGGVALGAGIGAGVGAITGAAGDDRGRGPRQQRRRRLQRKAAANADSAVPQPSGSSGAPLDAAIRARMEPAFSRDFSAVRVHRDAQAQRRTAAANAYALTRGSDIDLAADADPSDTAQGRAILGHELAHVAQNATVGAPASAATLEAEATQASAVIAQGQPARIAHRNDGAPMALTRGEQTAAGAGIGAAGGAAIGALAGLGIAAATGASLGEGAGIGALIGLGAGALIGAIVGFAMRRTHPETTAETELLIRRRYGSYIGGSIPGPLRNASVHVVPHAELCERRNCRRNTPGESCEGLLGWTDSGPALQPSSGRYPAQIAATDEPTCGNRQMEHATPERPVIYYTGTAGTLIHEALHAYSHPDFGFLHNHVAEGTTEYFSRRLMADINMPAVGAYDAEVADIDRLVADVGEDTLARAYFRGDMAHLHSTFNARHGRCGFISWAWSLQMNSGGRAAAIMDSAATTNHCDSDIAGHSPAELTPGETSYRAPEPAETSTTAPSGARDE